MIHMFDLFSDNRIKPIAFYLPQFHAIPENDAAWGKGFTEWTNVKKAEPLFPGHYQPRVPLNKNYYDLLDDGVMEWQSELAQQYGVYGFCYYHYWFKDGKKLLEKPVEQMLHNKKITIPFCLSWANENWTKKWDAGNKEIIAEQEYGNELEWESHFQYLKVFFCDDRYIRVNDKPVFIIYRPESIPRLQDMLRYWEKRSSETGLKGICFMVQRGESYFNPNFDRGIIEYQIKFEPSFSNNIEKRLEREGLYTVLGRLGLYNKLRKVHQIIKKTIEGTSSKTGQIAIDYDTIWRQILIPLEDSTLIEGAFTDWDNTSRMLNGYRTDGATPELFGKYIKQLIKKIEDYNEPPVIFINAWNEWAEGAYLEPDEKYGYAYLEELKQALAYQ